MSGGARTRAVVVAIAVIAVGGLAAVLAGPPTGLLSGSRPVVTGFADGKFADGDWRPNWVSSTAPMGDADHYVPPIAINGSAAAAWAALEESVAAMPRVTIVRRSAGYLHAEFESRRMGFVDDGEFALDAAAGVIHAKSAARLGIRDFSVNRERVESIRAALARRMN